MRTATLTAPALSRLLGAWAARGPAYRDLAAAVRLLVLDGRVPLGAALPGERDLAAALGVSRTTVAAAYALLREQGHLTSRAGARSTTTLPAGSASGPVPALPFGAPQGVLDLAYAAMPAPEGVHAAYAAALDALPAHLPTSGYAPAGLPALREAVAARYRARGLPTAPEQVLVTSGAQAAWALVLGLLASPGDRVLVDAPTYPHALDAVRHASCRPVPVALPRGGAGWDVDGLRAALRQTAPRLAYLVPDCHNPTGRCMPAAQRAAVVRAAADSRTTLVVDESLVDLALDGPPPPPVAGEHVLSLGSTSKPFWAGLRIGWVRGPAEVVARLAALRTSVDMGSPVLEQLAVTALLADADRVLGPRREQLRARRDLLLGLLAEHLPEWEVEQPAGGLSVWARLPAAQSTALAAGALAQGVRLTAGPRFGVDGAFEREVRVPFTLPPEQLEQAVLGLARAARLLPGEAAVGAVA